MRVVILGCGYLGFNINKVFKEKYDCEIWGLKNYYSDKTDNFKEIDVFDVNALSRENLDDCILIDCISLISNTEEDESKIDLVRSKYNKLFNVLINKNIKRFIMLSSGGTIYGESFKPISETHLLNPLSVYARSKFILEEMLKESELNYLILRPTNPYGGEFEPGKLQGVIGILIKCALQHKLFYLWADEHSVRDYIYIDDFVNAIERLIINDINNDVVNISSAIGYSLKEVIDIIENLTGEKIEIERCNINVPIIQSIVLANDKLKYLTGFNVVTGLKEGIALEVERIKEEIK